MFQKNNLNGVITTAFVASIITGTGHVHAFGPSGAEVDAICANVGNELPPEFLAQVENNCCACHDGGTTAYLAGIAAPAAPRSGWT